MLPPESVIDESLPVPAAVQRLAEGHEIRPVWRNVLGGMTYEIIAPDVRFFVKYAPEGSGLPLAREAERLRWAARYVAVPQVVSEGADETGVWLQTRAMNGTSAVSERWRARPATAVDAIATGLRHLHDTLPVGECPFDWSVERRLAGKQHHSGDIHPDHGIRSLDEALRRVAAPPPIEKLVVCHGDPCSPNTLIGDDGLFAGHVDMASLGVADRWADLAVASWSLSWNYGPGWDERFFAAYGIEPDAERIAYYRLLWDFGE